MSAGVPTWDPQRDYWERIGITRGPHADQSDDFSTLLPKPDPGERLPDVVMVPGAIVTPPKQARTYIGPGVQRELDRARAFEVIALAAIALAEANDDDFDDAWAALDEAVAENRAAVQP